MIRSRRGRPTVSLLLSPATARSQILTLRTIPTFWWWPPQYRQGVHPRKSPLPGQKDHPPGRPTEVAHYSASTDLKLFYYATGMSAVSPSVVATKRFSLRRLTGWPASPLCAGWKSVYFLADDDGTQTLAQVNFTDGKVTRAIGGRLNIDGYSFSKARDTCGDHLDRRIAYEVFAIPGGNLTG